MAVRGDGGGDAAVRGPLASATGRTTDGAADGHPPVRGAAPLYVSDYADNDVLRVPPGGGEPTTVAATGLTRPTGMVLDASGDLYIADTGNNRVVRLPGDGGPQTVVPTTDLSRPIGLALDTAGTLYISDSFNDRVVKIPADGSGQVTVPTTGLLHPNGLALDGAGNLFIADFVNDRVVRIPADGVRRRPCPPAASPSRPDSPSTGTGICSSLTAGTTVWWFCRRAADRSGPLSGDRAQLPVRSRLRPGEHGVRRGLQQRPGGEAADARWPADPARRGPARPGRTGRTAAGARDAY